MPVAVFALDGKQVLNAETDAQGKADLSALAGGTYLVSIVVDGAVKTVKFVRK
ncbi:MAG: T9SS type A sorting domain-containing protein [Bacteroidales bacterium]|nr:MAG: T9SS type A sorting domain-containing protein [Bacteroidales bacterium]